MSKICNVATELNKIRKWAMKLSTYLTSQTQETGTYCCILCLMKRKYQFFSIVDLSPLRNLHIFERWSLMRTWNLYKILNELSTWKWEWAIDLVNSYDQLFDFLIGTTDICVDIFFVLFLTVWKVWLIPKI